MVVLGGRAVSYERGTPVQGHLLGAAPGEMAGQPPHPLPPRFSVHTFSE